jgi:hypothetical protein
MGAGKLPGTPRRATDTRIASLPIGTANGQGGVLMKASAIWLWPGQWTIGPNRAGPEDRRIPNAPENKKEKSAFGSSSTSFEETRDR